MDQYLTKEFSEKIVNCHGEAGEKWLRRLPQTLNDVGARWAIQLLSPYQPLSYNYVAPAIRSDGESVVLKAGVPSREFSSEINALEHFGGQGMVRLFTADHDAGFMLLERIEPGEPLHGMKDDCRATSVFAEVTRRMRKVTPGERSFPSVSDWAKGFLRLRNRFEGTTGPLPKSVVDRAEAMMTELIDSMSNPIVLHGDLHHWNILSSEREPWLALDPKGVIGEPEYEVGAWLRNPFPQILQEPNLQGIMARRADQLVEELGFDRSRVVEWAYCQAVLAGVWSYEDGSDDWRGWLACADHFASPLTHRH